MIDADENGPGVQTGAGNRDATGIKDCGKPDTVIVAQSQFVIAAHHVRPELAGALAAIVFAGGVHD